MKRKVKRVMYSTCGGVGVDDHLQLDGVDRGSICSTSLGDSSGDSLACYSVEGGSSG